MNQTIQPSTIQELVVAGIDFIYDPQNLLILVGVTVFIVIMMWFVMKPALNMDDNVWGMLTFIFMVFLFFSFLMLIERGVIVLDFKSIVEQLGDFF